MKEFFDQSQPKYPAINELPRVLKCWRPPILNGLKCNVDATFRGDSKVGAIAVIRDNCGALITASAYKICYSSSLVAKALAIREGLKLANNCLCDSIVLESDNLQTIEACRTNKSLGEIAVVLEDIRALRNLFSSCAFTCTPCEGNRVAHHVAQLTLAGSLRGD